MLTMTRLESRQSMSYNPPENAGEARQIDCCARQAEVPRRIMPNARRMFTWFIGVL